MQLNSKHSVLPNISSQAWCCLPIPRAAGRAQQEYIDILNIFCTCLIIGLVLPLPIPRSISASGKILTSYFDGDLWVDQSAGLSVYRYRGPVPATESLRCVGVIGQGTEAVGFRGNEKIEDILRFLELFSIDRLQL